jgi:hypothetical protein
VAAGTSAELGGGGAAGAMTGDRAAVQSRTSAAKRRAVLHWVAPIKVVPDRVMACCARTW